MNILKVIFASTGLSTLKFDQPFYKGQHLENQIEVTLPSGHASVTSVTLGATKPDGTYLASAEAFTLNSVTGAYELLLNNWYTEFSGLLNVLVTVNFSASTQTAIRD